MGSSSNAAPHYSSNFAHFIGICFLNVVLSDCVRVRLHQRRQFWEGVDLSGSDSVALNRLSELAIKCSAWVTRHLVLLVEVLVVSHVLELSCYSSRTFL